MPDQEYLEACLSQWRPGTQDRALLEEQGHTVPEKAPPDGLEDAGVAVGQVWEDPVPPRPGFDELRHVRVMDGPDEDGRWLVENKATLQRSHIRGDRFTSDGWRRLS